jgi:hypothetical protein
MLRTVALAHGLKISEILRDHPYNGGRWIPLPKHLRASRSGVSSCCRIAASCSPMAGRSSSAVALDVLLALIEARGAVVSKDALMTRVWPDRIVEENNLQWHFVARISSEGEISSRHRLFM